ncbi:MAG: alpha-glucosidase [Rubellimicrobium sp.]|nr:alpha-glucosidase [Rubellimicrobium sp.]
MDEWWRGAAIYQIYPRSFQDSDGDGVGDLAGIIRRLDHVAALGVDAVWLSPFFTSPGRDMGYDVSDYRDVDPVYGSLRDFDALVARAHELGLRVIIDLVLSHTSDRHPWFEESRASRAGARADWYVWADPRADGTPPTNWPSVFGGPAWTFDPRRRQYYLHNFLPSQPDLNYHNPEVVEAVLDVMRFWIGRGVDGFRLDTVNYYTHDARLRDNPASEWPLGDFPANPYGAQQHLFSKSRPENLKVMERMRAVCDASGGAMMVGEIGDDGMRQVELMGEYTGPGRLHLAYSFAMLGPEHSAAHFRRCVEGFYEHAPGGTPSWSFSNHDVPRHVSRWTPPGGDARAVARQSIALLAALPGAIGIYQGEELGQTETDILFEELRDTARIAFWPEDKGRDGCRTPMTWESTAANAGFSTGTPWLPVKAPQAAHALDLEEARPDGIPAAYRETLAFRRASPALRAGAVRFLDLPEPVLGIERAQGDGRITALFNLSAQARRLKITGKAALAGPVRATLARRALALPAWGFAYLASSAALTVETT